MNPCNVASGADAVQPSASGGAPTFVGINLGGCWLDTHLEPGGEARRIPNDKLGWQAAQLTVRGTSPKHWACWPMPTARTPRRWTRPWRSCKIWRSCGTGVSTSSRPWAASSRSWDPRPRCASCACGGPPPDGASKALAKRCWLPSRPMPACAGAPKCRAQPRVSVRPPLPASWPQCPSSAWLPARTAAASTKVATKSAPRPAT